MCSKDTKLNAGWRKAKKRGRKEGERKGNSDA